MRTKEPKQSSLQPEIVVKTALEMLDAEGLEGVTLRRLAARLGVQAPALYWHFKNKRDLLDEMAQAILSSQPLAELEPPTDPGAWVPWVREMVHRLREALLSHREGARVIAGAGLGRAQALTELAERTIQVLHSAGFDPLVASLATVTLESYTFGFVIEEQAAPPPAVSQQALDHLAIEFPMMALILNAQETTTSADTFDWGVQVILDGLRVNCQVSS